MGSIPTTSTTRAPGGSIYVYRTADTNSNFTFEFWKNFACGSTPQLSKPSTFSAIQLISFNVVWMYIIGHAEVAQLVEQRTISLCFVKARIATLNGQSVCRRLESSLPLHASFGGWL